MSPEVHFDEILNYLIVDIFIDFENLENKWTLSTKSNIKKSKVKSRYVNAKNKGSKLENKAH